MERREREGGEKKRERYLCFEDFLCCLSIPAVWAEWVEGIVTSESFKELPSIHNIIPSNCKKTRGI